MELIRYKVVNNYPNSVYKEGEILKTHHSGANFFNKYPHIFKKLAFYEEEAVENLPNYIKFIWEDKIQEVARVKRYLSTFSDSNSEINAFEVVKEGRNELRFPTVSLSGWIPATKEEYDNYQAYGVR